jgi:hypothetical protein
MVYYETCSHLTAWKDHNGVYKFGQWPNYRLLMKLEKSSCHINFNLRGKKTKKIALLVDMLNLSILSVHFTFS